MTKKSAIHYAYAAGAAIPGVIGFVSKKIFNDDEPIMFTLAAEAATGGYVLYEELKGHYGRRDFASMSALIGMVVTELLALALKNNFNISSQYALAISVLLNIAGAVMIGSCTPRARVRP